jgi:ElaB/YqjD/DUF883 family membrane-anchored ribosome-binding protein
MPRKLTCFVIIPSNRADGGTEFVADACWGLCELPSSCQKPSYTHRIDFDEVYGVIIGEAIQELNKSGLDVVIQHSCGKDIAHSGDIRKQVVERICRADLTITDVTGNNPNVLLEYGIRLSVRDSGNLLICHESVAPTLPFNINHLRAIPYSTAMAGAKKAREEIVKFITSYLSGEDEAERNLYHEYVNAFTGRRLQQKMADVAHLSPDLIAVLSNLALAKQEASEYRQRVFEYLMSYKDALAEDPNNQSAVIQHLEMVASLERLGPGRIRQTLYELAKICMNDPMRKEQGMKFLEKAKQLED